MVFEFHVELIDNFCLKFIDELNNKLKVAKIWSFINKPNKPDSGFEKLDNKVFAVIASQKNITLFLPVLILMTQQLYTNMEKAKRNA